MSQPDLDYFMDSIIFDHCKTELKQHQQWAHTHTQMPLADNHNAVNLEHQVLAWDFAADVKVVRNPKGVPAYEVI